MGHFQEEKAMKNFKKIIAAALLIVMALSLGACGCSKNDAAMQEVVVESLVSGGEVMNQLWAADLDASAEFIDGYHAVSVKEVLNIWKQAHMQKNDAGIVNGNGALIYGICSPELRVKCLEAIKKIGLWNFYYSSAVGGPDQTKVPQGMVFSKPERFQEGERIWYEVEVNEISYSGEKVRYELYIDCISGGYYLTGRTDPYKVKDSK